VQIIIEALVAVVLGILGASLNAPPLKEITWASEMQKRYESVALLSPNRPADLGSRSKIDEMDSRLGFASFVNRGRNVLSRHRALGQMKER